jgi:ABC-type phosphonate transport system ATPase subunit
MVHISEEQILAQIDPELMALVQAMGHGSSPVMALHIHGPSSAGKTTLLKHVSQTFGMGGHVGTSRRISGVPKGVAGYIGSSGRMILMDESHCFGGITGKRELANFVAACIAADKRLILAGERKFTEIFTADDRRREMAIRPDLE